jgi:hypothetical protein
LLACPTPSFSASDRPLDSPHSGTQQPEGNKVLLKQDASDPAGWKMIFEPFIEQGNHKFKTPTAKMLFDFYCKKQISETRKYTDPVGMPPPGSSMCNHIREYGLYREIKTGGFLIKDRENSFYYVVPSANTLEDIYTAKNQEIIEKRSADGINRWLFFRSTSASGPAVLDSYFVISITERTKQPGIVKGQYLEIAKSASPSLAACGLRDLEQAEHIVKFSFEDGANDGEIKGIALEATVKDCTVKSNQQITTKKTVTWHWNGADWSRSELK